MAKRKKKKRPRCGIVCYAIHNGEAHVLMGKELYGSNVWCDFGGGAHRDEELDAAAAREFFEETMGIVSTGGTYRPPILFSASAEDTLADIRSGRYAFTLNVEAEDRYSRTYAFQVPWQNIGTIFRKLHLNLTSLQHSGRHIARLRELIRRWQRGTDAAYIVGDIHISGEVVCVVSPYTFDDDVLRYTVDTASGKTHALAHSREALGKMYMCDALAVIQTLFRIRHVHTCAIRMFNHLPGVHQRHPALTVTRYNTHIINIAVNDVFMEKSFIEWWTLDKLERVCLQDGENGRWNRHVPQYPATFKPYALLLVDTLRHIAASSDAAASAPNEVIASSAIDTRPGLVR